MSTHQAIKKPSFLFDLHVRLNILKMRVTVCLGLFNLSLCKKKVNMNSSVIHDEFSPPPTLEKAFLSANLCTETQLKAFMLQSQFTAK